MSRILIIDDDKQLCDAVSLVIRSMGLEADTAYSIKEGIEALSAGVHTVVILDIRLPDGDGLKALPMIRESANRPEVIILSGSGDPDGAELAIRNGAWSYITKPPTVNKIKLPVQRALDYHQSKKLGRTVAQLKRENIIGSSRALQRCLELTAQAADTDSNVLITGETGTGKELFARAIHANSSRAEYPFIVVDCAAMPENLVESMLFGHEKGAFTGADRKFTGLIKQADKGTLFLDEVGELPLSMQKAFLRVLQDRRFRPVGGEKEVGSDFRLTAATNRELEAMVHNWDFRQDLLFRLRTVTINLPPLRERRSDIKELALYFTEKLHFRSGGPKKKLSDELLDALKEYSWPGNIRELVHALESASAVAAGEETLLLRHLPTDIRAELARKQLSGSSKKKTSKQPDRIFSGKQLPSLKEYRTQALEEIESHYIAELMEITDSDIKEACRISGLSRARLYALLKKYDIKRTSGSSVGQANENSGS